MRKSNVHRVKKRRESALALFNKQANEYKVALSSGVYRGLSIKGQEEYFETKMNKSLEESIILHNKLFS